jgi:hypothetical protein
VIVLDTTVLVYAVGDDHELREPAPAIVEAVEDGRIQAGTTVEARRRSPGGTNMCPSDGVGSLVGKNDND